MINDACTLASSGLNQQSALIMAVVITVLMITFFILRRKYALKGLWILPIILLLFTITSPLRYAFAAENCTDVSASNRTTNNTVAEGNLVNDSPSLTEDEESPGSYFARFLILNNDNAPEGDPFDVSTLRLLGDTPRPLYWGWLGSGFNILDPDDQTPLTDPDDPYTSSNYWGMWSLEVCDPTSYDCETTPMCDDYTDHTICKPTGYVNVYLNERTTPSVPLTIPYDVKTQSGRQLTPATISVAIPMPSPITAQIDILFTGPCFTWNFDPEFYGEDYSFSVDLMDGANITTTNDDAALLPSTIDLDPSTPGRQTSFTAYDTEYPEYFTTFTVDNYGLVTMSSPQSGDSGADNDYILYFTIQDELGNLSNTGILTYHAIDCG